MAHIPVMKTEAVQYLNCSPGKNYLDCTLGAGGHAQEILERIQPGGCLWGLDQDQGALGVAQIKLAPYGDQVSFIRGNFGDLEEVAREYGLPPMDGILLDLGVSSLQLDQGERGFSYRHPGPLDMRMGQGGTGARELLNRLPERELSEIIKKYGEEPFHRRIARFIARGRQVKEIETTGELVEIIKQAIPARARRKGGHPARRTFQALRIAVNQELANLEKVLPVAVDLLKGGGRLCVISYHSLEDRIVKKFLARRAAGCTCPPGFPACACGGRAALRLVTRRPLVPGPGETRANPRARSARLRAAEKI